MSNIQETTFRRGYRILLLYRWAKAVNCSDFDEIVDHALLKFFIRSRKTAESYAKEVLLRLEKDRLSVKYGRYGGS